MDSEKLVKWEPISGIPKKLYLSGLSDDERGLCLSLVGETNEPVLTVKFESALSYRNTDEGDSLKFLNEVSGQLDWSLYTLSGSKYVDWFNNQSYSLHAKEDIKHFLFLTPNDIVDVLSLHEPSVEYK